MSILENFVSIITLFVIGSLIGWIIEVFFRRYYSQKKWTNPGFLVGPYLPIYGFGVVILYGLSNISYTVLNPYLTTVFKLITISVSITLLEFIAGLIFIKGLKIKLWDYSNEKGNILGIICPRYSILWLLLSALYYFLINPSLVNTVYFLANKDHHIYYFFIGFIVGMMLVDFGYSTHLATRIRNLAKKHNIVVNFNNFKELIKDRAKQLLNKTENDYIKKPKLFTHKGVYRFLDDYIYDYVESLKENPNIDE